MAEIETENSFDDINVIDYVDSPTALNQETSPNVSNAVTKPLKKKHTVFQEHVSKAMEKRTHKEEDFDGNKHFLLSLLPAMKGMEAQNNIKFRIDIMQLVQKYTTDNQTSQPYSSHQLYTPPQPYTPYYHHQFQPYVLPFQPYTQQTLENTVGNQEYFMTNQNTNNGSVQKEPDFLS